MREKELQNEQKLQYEQLIRNMKEDMKKIKDEWERRLHEEDLEYQRKLVEQDSKHAI